MQNTTSTQGQTFDNMESIARLAHEFGMQPYEVIAFLDIEDQDDDQLIDDATGAEYRELLQAGADAAAETAL